jgi:chitin disaccharide deacetylase
MLCADDYAMTAGISRSIEILAAARRLSATSAMTNSRHWALDAPRIREHRGSLSIGLHLNFTLGAPLSARSHIAPQGHFPPLKTILRLALTGQLKTEHLASEIARQLDAFETVFGTPPDHIDGHQHVQVLPTIRTALITELARRYPNNPPLLRDPTDRRVHGLPFSRAALKARIANGLAAGFSAAAATKGIPVNSGFSGFSAFDTTQSYGDELATECAHAGPRHIVMCHPGFNDAELATLDPVTARRDQEHQGLLDADWLSGRLWTPQRNQNGPAVDWAIAWPTHATI